MATRRIQNPSRQLKCCGHVKDNHERWHHKVRDEHAGSHMAGYRAKYLERDAKYCIKHATYIIEGVPGCRTHAGLMALQLLSGEAVKTDPQWQESCIGDKCGHCHQELGAIVEYSIYLDLIVHPACNPDHRFKEDHSMPSVSNNEEPLVERKVKVKIDIGMAVNDGKVVKFVCLRDDKLWYQTQGGDLFPVPLEDTKGASFLAEDRAILFMRWMRKWNDDVDEGNI